MHNLLLMVYLLFFTSSSLSIPITNTINNRTISEKVLWDIRPERSISQAVTSQNVRHGRENTRHRYTNNPEHFICGLDVYVDYSFFSKTCHSSTRCVVDKITKAVSVADRNFRRLDFDYDGLNDNVGFSIYRMVVNTGGVSGGQAAFTNTTSAHELLFEMARHSYLVWPRGSCLSVLFIDRSLDHSIIGLAYAGQAKQLGDNRGHRGHRVTIGGICQGNARILRYGVRRYSTLFVTSRRRGKLVTSSTLALTLTHEIGHAFGARHDDVDLTKTAPFGSYVMHPTDVHWNMAYSQRFSPVSIKQMSPVVRDAKCLDIVRASCGNYVTEDPEECDCGESRFCLMIDKCCVPSDKKENACRINRMMNYKCSPMSSACCNDICQIEPRGKSCRPASKCTAQSLCDGQSPECPQSKVLQDGTLCDNGARVCRAGQCDLSRCEHEGFVTCDCEKEKEKCMVCCRIKTSSKCIPVHLLLNSDHVIYIQQSDFCDGGLGYCDGTHVCVLPFKNNIHALLSGKLKSGKSMMHSLNSTYFLCIVCICLVLLALITLFERYRDETINYTAFKLSQNVFRRQNIQIQNIRLKRKTREDKSSLHRNKVQLDQLFSQGRLLDNTLTSVARLCLLFPETPRDRVVDTLRNSYDESACVRELLRNDQPMMNHPI